MSSHECERCLTLVDAVFRVYDVDGSEEWLCKSCIHDYHHARSRGKVPQDPDADLRPTGWDEPGAYKR